MQPEFLPFQSEDADALWQLLYRAVHQLNCRDYTDAQLDAWAPAQIDRAAWRRRLEGTRPRVMWLQGRIAGFAELLEEGWIDCFFLEPDFVGRGLAGQLMQHLVEQAKTNRVACLAADVSITAKSFFQTQGFVVEKQKQTVLRQLPFTHFRMTKVLG